MTTLPHGGSRARVIAQTSVATPDKAQRDRRAMQMSYQEFFAVRWSEFLRENFRSPEEIAVHFQVTAVTARNWLDGTTAPRGHCVARAFSTHPQQASALTRDAA